MQVFFTSRDAEGTSRDAEGAALRELVLHRVNFVMRRMTWLVPRATVHLSDVNGPRGGVDKRCQVQFKTDRSGTVVITSMGRDWGAALDNALARATRVLLRLRRRSQSQRSSVRRAIPCDR